MNSISIAQPSREQRRALARSDRRKPTRPRRSRSDHIANNPIAQASLRKRIEDDVRKLRTRAGLLAHLSGDGVSTCDAAGRLLFTVAHAAAIHGLHESPDAKILLGTANALGDVAAAPDSLDAQRAAILSGLNACERLLPHLHTWSLCAGALELDQILSKRDFMTGDVLNALRNNAEHFTPTTEGSPS